MIPHPIAGVPPPQLILHLVPWSPRACPESARAFCLSWASAAPRGIKVQNRFRGHIWFFPPAGIYGAKAIRGGFIIRNYGYTLKSWGSRCFPTKITVSPKHVFRNNLFFDFWGCFQPRGLRTSSPGWSSSSFGFRKHMGGDF